MTGVDPVTKGGVGGANLPVGSRREPARGLRGSRGRQLGATYALPLIFLAFVVFFSIAEPDTYFTVDNLKTTINNQAVLGLAAIALLVPLIVGEFDLSVGANLGLGAILVTGLPSKEGMDLVPAIFVAVALCTGVGAINGLLVTKVKINALVATLGTGTIVTGSVLWYTDGATIFEGIPSSLQSLAENELLGIPLPGVYLAVVAIVVGYGLSQTPLGRHLYALGGSKEAAHLSGLRVTRLTILAFTTAGLIAGLAGVLQGALLGSGNPAVGPPLLLPAFAAAFLGATTIKVGTFNVLGTIVAVFTLAAGIIGLQLMGVAFYIAPIFQGAALLVAVAAVRILRREAI
jgi:ribose transport system permease protein